MYVGSEWQGNAQNLTGSKHSPVASPDVIVGRVHSVATCDESGHWSVPFGEFRWKRLYFFPAPLSRANVGANRPGSWHDMHE